MDSYGQSCAGGKTATAGKKEQDKLAFCKRKQMVEFFQDSILSGEMQVGEMLPTEAELMKTYALSRHSVRLGLDSLVSDNLIERTPGRGTVVRLASKRVKLKTVSFVAQDPSEWLAAGIAGGLQDGLEQKDTRLELVSAGDTQEEFYEAIEELLCRRPDGVVVLPLPWITNNEWVFRLRMEKLPAVVLDSYPMGTEIDSVEMDNKMSGYLAGKHLIEQGYNRLYFIGIDSQTSTTNNRQDGFLHAVVKAGSAVETCVPIRYSIDKEILSDHRHPWKASELFWKNYCKSLLDGGVRLPIGVVGSSDFDAYGVVAACRSLGLEVGKEVGVVGMDDRDISMLCHPPLTTLHHSPRQLGQNAAELLQRRMSDPDCEYRHIYLKPNLVVRETTKRK